MTRTLASLAAAPPTPTSAESNLASLAAPSAGINSAVIPDAPASHGLCSRSTARMTKRSSTSAVERTASSPMGNSVVGACACPERTWSTKGEPPMGSAEVRSRTCSSYVPERLIE